MPGRNLYPVQFARELQQDVRHVRLRAKVARQCELLVVYHRMDWGRLLYNRHQFSQHHSILYRLRRYHHL